MYYHPGRAMRCLVHGDDFVCVGEAEDVKWLEDRLEERFEIKSKIMGLRDGESREERILNRVIRVIEGGWEYEVDRLLIADVSRAFFEAPAKRDLSVEFPEEAIAAGEIVASTVGKLKASLYGTRDASTN